MPTMSGIRLTTPMGDVQVTAHGDGPGPAVLTVRADGMPALRRLPPGMRIDGGALILIEGAFAAGGTVAVSMMLHPSRPLPDAEPNPGEHLDCVVISDGGRHLALAARDTEWMAARQPDAPGYAVRTMPAGLAVEAGPFTAGARIRLPLALAWASGPDPLTVWFGVDAILPN